MSLTGFNCVFEGNTGIHFFTVLLGFTCFNLVLHGSTRFYWVLLYLIGFFIVVLGLSGPHWT